MAVEGRIDSRATRLTSKMLIGALSLDAWPHAVRRFYGCQDSSIRQIAGKFAEATIPDGAFAFPSLLLKRKRESSVACHGAATLRPVLLSARLSPRFRSTGCLSGNNYCVHLFPSPRHQRGAVYNFYCKSGGVLRSEAWMLPARLHLFLSSLFG